MPSRSRPRYRFKEGDNLNYELANESSLTINGESGYVTKVQYDVCWRVKKGSSNGRATVVVRFDRLRYLMETPSGTKDSEGRAAGGRIEYDSRGVKKFEGPAGKAAEVELKKLPHDGLEFEMTVDAVGRITAPKNHPLEIWEAAFFLPEEPLKKGKSWRKEWSTAGRPFRQRARSGFAADREYQRCRPSKGRYRKGSSRRHARGPAALVRHIRPSKGDSRVKGHPRYP